jgi:ABC transporter
LAARERQEWGDVLELQGLTRRYGDLVALDDLSFTVREGQMFGFVGSNGAGKTTAMRIILGVLAPDAGEVRWRGQPMNDEMRKRLGYLPEDHGQTFSQLCAYPASRAEQRGHDLMLARPIPCGPSVTITSGGYDAGSLRCRGYDRKRIIDSLTSWRSTTSDRSWAAS